MSTFLLIYVAGLIVGAILAGYDGRDEAELSEDGFISLLIVTVWPAFLLVFMVAALVSGFTKRRAQEPAQ